MVLRVVYLIVYPPVSEGHKGHDDEYEHGDDCQELGEQGQWGSKPNAAAGIHDQAPLSTPSGLAAVDIGTRESEVTESCGDSVQIHHAILLGLFFAQTVDILNELHSTSRLVRTTNDCIGLAQDRKVGVIAID
jgi:hypothetical protein